MAHSRSEIVSAIRSIIADRLQTDAAVDQLTESTGLLGQGIGIDSIEVVQLVLGLEANLGVFVEDDDMLPENFRTIGAVIDLVERLESNDVR